MVKQKYIFGLEGSKHGIFKIYPAEAASENNLRWWIELCGGACVDNDDPYAIPILDLLWCQRHNRNSFRKDNKRDVFKSLFIHDCYKQNKVLNLNLYKLGDSILTDYDANLILERKLSWEQVIDSTYIPEPLPRPVTNKSVAPPLPHPEKVGKSVILPPSRSVPMKSSILPRRSVAVKSVIPPPSRSVAVKSVLPPRPIVVVPSLVPSPANLEPVKTISPPRPGTSNGTSNGKVDSKGSKPNKAPKPNADNRPSRPEVQPREIARSRRTSTDSSISTESRPKKRGARYEYEESVALLKYICDHEKHFLTGGNQMWIEMEDAGILAGRTHQSLKEHFRKQISTNLDIFQCSEIDKKKFEKAKKVRDGGRRRPQEAQFFRCRP